MHGFSFFMLIPMTRFSYWSFFEALIIIQSWCYSLTSKYNGTMKCKKDPQAR